MTTSWLTRWRTSVGAAIVSVTGLTVAAGFAAHEYGVYRGFAIERLEQQVGALAKSSSVLLTEVDQSLRYVVSDAGEALDTPQFDAALFDALRTARATTHIPTSIFALDATGRLGATSGNAQPENYPLGDVDYAKVHIEGDHEGVFIGAARQGRLGTSAGKWIVGLSRAIRRADGSLVAIIVATIPIENLEPIIAVSYGNTLGVGAWVANDGSVLLRHPFDADAIVRQPVEQTAFYRRTVGQVPQGTLELFSYIDGVQRTMAWIKLDNFPIYAVVGIASGELMGEWDRAFALGLTSTGLFALLLLGSGYAVDRLRAANATAQRRADDRFDLLLSGIEDIFVTVDADFKLSAFNPAALRALGDGSTDIRGRSLFDLFPELAMAPLDQAFRTNVEQGQRSQIQIEQAATGQTLSMHIYPFMDGVAILAEQITDRLSMEARLYQSQKMEALGQLTGGIAHDFNNLLTVILGNAEALLDDPLQEQSRRNAEGIVHGAEQAAELTQQLLAFARQQPLIPRSVDLNRQIEGMRAMIRRVLSEAITFELDLSPDIWSVWIDPSQLEAALLNVVINARDAMPNGGKINIETTRINIDAIEGMPSMELKSGQYVRLAVTDTGTGMAPDIAARAFDPFFSTKPEGSGTGLGLSMVYGFARQSGGHVSIDSEPGAGTTISLYLPRALQDFSTTLPQQSDPADGNIEGGRERILVVEDNPLVREFTRNTLQQLGYTILDAADAAEAMALFAGGDAFDLLISDIVLPGEMSGPAMVEALWRQKHEFALLFMSGYPKSALKTVGSFDGTEILGKPFKRTALAKAVRSALDRLG